MALKITAVTVYALLTVTLALLKGFKVDSRGRGAVKMITAAIFVAAGIYGCVTNGGEYGFVLVIGLAFAFLGDLFLVFMNKRALFISGVISFSVGRLSSGWIITAVSAVAAIGVAVIVYALMVITMRAVTLEDMKLIPKGEKIARLLHIR